MNTVTKSIALLAVLATATGVGLSFTRSAKSAPAADPQLARDLELAAADLPAASLGVTNALENAPISAPEVKPVPREGAGSRVTRARRAPTIRSAPAPEPAETEVAASPMVLTPISGQAERSEGSTEGVALPAPVATPYPGTGSSDNGGWGRGGSGGGSGGMGGGIIGVVLRGGGVDGDNCEIHDRGRARPPVYYPNPGGMAGARIGSVITGGRGAMRPARPATSDGGSGGGMMSRGPRGIPTRRGG